jgi:hypothetical protein
MAKLYKIGYWIGDDETNTMDLVTEMVTSDPEFAAESIRALSYTIEEAQDEEKEVDALNRKVEELGKALRHAEKARSPRWVKEDWEAGTEDVPVEATPAPTVEEAWKEAGAKLAQAFERVHLMAANNLNRKAQAILDAAPILAAMQEKD